ncbi:terminase [Clostridium botulinum D/C]|uniref:terminase n=1 Tax=Clostridium botulinum TaxID=1491 RepID=UPI001E65C6C0|nr:terminase [Clostridium botulinum]MCD3234257.1 terminase [Clostridium botulinum D/C]MCD3240315.1 terminase [Clostridium botulinum D/C]MCD3267676.1 terminase [Clostridium botulinum D/C]MCD3306147.1 terminase [Clostridium botulinum D/C]MCD3314857.1 terminase [Clostridium botulinum D/C]
MIFPDLQFWIKTPDDIFQLPIPPGEFNISCPSLNKTVTIMNYGELNIPGNEALKTWTVSSFFPKQYYTFCQCEPDPPYKYIKILEKAKKEKGICRCVLTGTPLNLQCIIEGFEYGEKDGTRDVYFTISFKEWRPLKGCEVRI